MQNWSIYVYENDFWNGLKKLETIIAFNEAKKRGWYSYYELSCLIDTIKLTIIVKTIVSISSICIATYAAGIFTLLGSALVASHLPGTSLSSKTQTLPVDQSINQSSFIENSEIIEFNHQIDPDNIQVDFKNLALNENKSRTILRTNKCELNCWINWLPGYFDYLILNYLNTENSFGDMNIGLNRNIGTFITDSQTIDDDKFIWDDDLITQLNWKDTINDNFHCDNKDWRYYARYVAISLGYQH